MAAFIGDVAAVAFWKNWTPGSANVHFYSRAEIWRMQASS
ncbi:MAG: hypothetical protein LZF60_120072 [Nitrospira sp.]|nr:MAG: hypothetical protein LZF60_120072 [Nitrospira sp.]